MSRLVKLLWIWAVVFALAVGAALLADNPGRVSMDWHGWRVDTSVAVLIVIALLITGAALAAFGLWGSAFRQAGALGRFIAHRRERARSDALTLGLLAAAAGDGRAARRQLAIAEKGGGDERLLLLLRAQTAQLGGMRAEAEAAFTAMLDSPDTEGLGIKGLLVEARHAGDRERALGYAARAFRSMPKARWVFDALFELQTRFSRWQDALKSLETASRNRLLARHEVRRRRAVLLLAEAVTLQSQSETQDALALAKRALRLEPGFTPAALLAADIEHKQGRNRRAAAIVETAWKHNPHPDLAGLYSVLKEDEDAEKRFRRMAALADLNKNHVESRLVRAHYALEAGKPMTAEEILGGLLHPAPTARVCSLMAEIERSKPGPQDLAAIEGWMARAAHAPRDGLWLCSACGRQSEVWNPVCGQCGGFDTMVWQAIGEAHVLTHRGEGTEALPIPAPVAGRATPAPKAANGSAADDKAGEPKAPEETSSPAPEKAAPKAEAKAKAKNGEKPGGAEKRPEPAKAREPQDFDPKIYVPPRQPDDPGPDEDENPAAKGDKSRHAKW